MLLIHLSQVPFAEEYWHLHTPMGPMATTFELLSVLANLTELSFTAEFTEVCMIGQYSNVSLNQCSTRKRGTHSFC